MKQIFIILFHFIFLNLFSQETYTNNAKAYYNGEVEFGNLRNNNASVNEITLNPDFTYEMWKRPLVSCSSWRSFKGTWEKVGTTLLFTEKYEVKESDVSEIYTNDKNIQKYVLTFKTDQEIVLKDLKVKIDYEYDFDSKVKFNESIYFVTDDNGRIEIPYKAIPHQDKLASLRFELNFNDREIADYLTENNTLNVKQSELPNSIKIVIRENPKKEIITRTIKARTKNDEIKIISVNVTSGKLKDYNKKLLRLEKKYTLEVRSGR